jgi:hypothetical protein
MYDNFLNRPPANVVNIKITIIPLNFLIRRQDDLTVRRYGNRHTFSLLLPHELKETQ